MTSVCECLEGKLYRNWLDLGEILIADFQKGVHQNRAGWKKKPQTKGLRFLSFKELNSHCCKFFYTNILVTSSDSNRNVGVFANTGSR